MILIMMFFLASKHQFQILAVSNKAIFCPCYTLMSIPIAGIDFSKPVDIAPNAPTTTGITITSFMPHILAISFLSTLYFSIFPTSLSFNRTSPGMVTSTFLTSFLALSVTTISGRRASILVSHWIVNSHRILYPLF